MPRKKESLTLSVPPGTKEKLEAIARRLKILWGKSPSPSGLVAAIAQQSLEVGQPFTLDSAQVNALQQATKDLIDTGHVEEAGTVLALLIERGNLEAPLRQSLLQQVSQPTEGWRIVINKHIQEQQPFHLVYRNSQHQELEYTVRHAEIIPYEKRLYLQIWCEETQDVENENRDLPELWHNRCLRLDRIQAVLPVSGDWRGEFDAIKVYLQFRGWLIKAYEPKKEDENDEMIGSVRQVVRRVVNPFWLLREVSRYREDCVIVAPEAMLERYKQELRAQCQLYDLKL